MSETIQVAADASRRPPGRYHGSKHTIGPWIIGHLPGDHDTYVEPYCGMANVLMLKERSLIEAINDLNGDVVNFFRVLRERPEELIRAIDLTPFAFEEWQLSYKPAVRGAGAGAAVLRAVVFVDCGADVVERESGVPAAEEVQPGEGRREDNDVGGDDVW